LGDKEEKTRNPVLATVGDRIREASSLLSEHGVKCVLEWNKGNHFKDADVRTAKAFSWVIRS
ncbi:MAG: esterase, partial [Oscillospiraceae bacterium]|nr:esterase [Oscillospiraceae bacterium]